MSDAAFDQPGKPVRLEHSTEFLSGTLRVVGVNPLEDAGADEVLGVIAEHPGDGRAFVAHRSIVVEDGDEVGSIFDERPEILLTPSQREIAPPTLRGGG